MPVAEKIATSRTRAPYSGRMSSFEHEHAPTGLQARLAIYEDRRKRMKALGFAATYDDIAARMGVTKSSVARIFSGDRKKIASDEELKLARTLDQMEAEAKRIYGEDAIASAPATPAGAQEGGFDFSQLMPGGAPRIPVYGLSGPDHTVRLDNDFVVVAIDDVTGASNARQPFLLEVAGCGGEPRFLQGERVIAARNRPPRPGQDAVFEFADGHTELKIYRARRDGRIWFDQWNHDDADFDPASASYDASQIRAIHAVTGVFF